MKIQTRVKKYHLKGILEGMTTNERMSFTDWDSACEWAGSVTTNVDVSYVVLEMRNLETGQLEKF